MSSSQPSSAGPWFIGIFIFCGAMAAVILLALVFAVITEKRAEVASIFNNKRENIEGIEPRSAIWGRNYPREYESFQ